MPQPFNMMGRMLIIAGVVLIVVGALLIWGHRLGLFRLPGDLNFGGENWRVFFPIGTCLLLSALATLIFWLIAHFRNR